VASSLFSVIPSLLLSELSFDETMASAPGSASKTPVIEVDDSDDDGGDEDSVDEEQLDEYREMVENLGNFPVRFATFHLTTHMSSCELCCYVYRNELSLVVSMLLTHAFPYCCMNHTQDKVQINSLTMVAEDYSETRKGAKAIYNIIRERLLSATVAREKLLPLVYLVDSIIKNAK
jgi:hypothetical protein